MNPLWGLLIGVVAGIYANWRTITVCYYLNRLVKYVERCGPMRGTDRVEMLLLNIPDSPNFKFSLVWPFEYPSQELIEYIRFVRWFGEEIRGMGL